MPEAYDVITVGSATLDVFAHTDSELIKIKTRESEQELIAYKAGTKILIEKLSFQTGGGGTNTAVAFSRLGLKTAFCGKLGKDSNGDEVIQQLAREKVDFIGRRGGDKTGYSVILDSIEEDRTILTYKGANNSLLWSELDKKKLSARFYYFSSMVGQSFSSMERIMAHARKSKAIVAFNPSSYLTKQGMKPLQRALDMTDILILNREEAEMLVGRHPFKNLPRILSRHGPKIIAVTDGRFGMHCHDGRKSMFFPARKVKVVETTGAGDAFASGMVGGLALGKELRFSVKLGIANATSVVMHLGAKNKLLTMKEATLFMKRRGTRPGSKYA
jgi:ribokinase